MREPSAGRVFREHLSLVGRVGGGELGGFIAVAFLLCITAAAKVTATHSYADRVLGVQFLALVFAAYWPVVVWRDEPPRRRLHLRSLPVDPALAALLRVAAGGCWLVAALLTTNLAAAALGAAIGRGAEFLAITPLAWLAYGFGVAIVYLLASAAALVSDNPVRWIVLLMAFVYAPPLLLEVPSALHFTFRFGPSALYRGAFGFDTATRWAVTEAQLEASLAGFAVGRWLLASVVWLAATILLVVTAARRRPDV